MRGRVAVGLLTLIMLVASFGVVPGRAAGSVEGESAPGVLIPVFVGPAIDPTFVPPPAGGARAASATFIVNYSGFSPEARNAFQAAVDIWATQIASPVPIVVNALFGDLGGNFIGFAGPTKFWRDFAGAPQANTWYPLALANKLHGSDLATDLGDINATFSNSNIAWYFGTGATPPGTINFTSLVLHELGHGLGFVTSASYTNGQGAWGFPADNSPAVTPTIFDALVANGTGQQIVNTALFANPSAALGMQYTGGALFFNGAAAKAANGGSAPRLYAPQPWKSGSSVLHLDEATYPAGNPNSLMTPSISPGEAIYDVGPITRGIFADIGWTTSGFADVPSNYWAAGQIGQFATREITNGCGEDQGQRYYCPERSVTRAEMAVFIARTLGNNAPAAPPTATFADVPTGYWAFSFIEKFAQLGITNGCGTDELGRRVFCPDRGVTRAEMAVFLDRAKGQVELAATTPTFADVPTNYWSYGWIERFLLLGITNGCDEDQGKRYYCPDRGVTRAEMAVFIIRAYP